MDKTAASLTEKKMSDRRFFKTEMLILEAVLEDPFASVAAISRSACISRPTFYRHHKNIAEIISDYEEFLSARFDNIINAFAEWQNVTSEFQNPTHTPLVSSVRQNSAQSSPLKKLYRDTLLFIYKHRRAFLILASRRDSRAFIFILEKLKPNFKDYNHLPKNSDRIFDIFTSEVSGILFNWSKVNFSLQKLDIVLYDLIFLSNSARSRLLPLIHE